MHLRRPSTPSRGAQGNSECDSGQVNKTDLHYLIEAAEGTDRRTVGPAADLHVLLIGTGTPAIGPSLSRELLQLRQHSTIPNNLAELASSTPPRCCNLRRAGSSGSGYPIRRNQESRVDDTGPFSNRMDL